LTDKICIIAYCTKIWGMIRIDLMRCVKVVIADRHPVVVAGLIESAG